jgi:hypothetical protein
LAFLNLDPSLLIQINPDPIQIINPVVRVGEIFLC